MHKIHVNFLCLLSLFVANSVFAQTNFCLVRGTVFSPEGRPVPGAKVGIARMDIQPKQQKKLLKQAVSDRLGEFAFRMNVGPAKFRVTVEAPGFATQEKEIEVVDDERTDISVVLKK